MQRDADLAKAKAAALQQEDLLAKLKRDLENFTMRAPFDGRVFYGQNVHGAWSTADQVVPFLHAGEKLPPGQVFLTVCSSRTRAVADLPEADYFDVAIEQSATVSPAAMPEAKREGAVRSKSLVALQKGQASAFEALIDLKEPPTELFPGMKGKATIKGKELRDVVVVPSNAIASSGGKCSVNVSKDGKSSSREVTIGKSDGKMTHVKSGLEAGEKISVPK